MSTLPTPIIIQSEKSTLENVNPSLAFKTFPFLNSKLDGLYVVSLKSLWIIYIPGTFQLAPIVTSELFHKWKILSFGISIILG